MYVGLSVCEFVIKINKDQLDQLNAEDLLIVNVVKIGDGFQ